ncbi:hypothetical protein ACFS7Z_13860 [Pontibacter toksunensis]|uniref:Uncharacterized protein n=1 Tax=Pontibacter toksunensis TaxID=1332631 RepID=A0ABW6BWJ4_9BACT
MDLIRKTWLLQSDSYIRLITEKEKYLAQMKQERAPAYRIKAVDDEIKFLIDFYNQTEKMMEVQEYQRLQLMLEKMLLSNEIRLMIRMLTQMRNLSTDPEAFMVLVSKVHDSASEVMDDNTLLRPDKAYQREIDKYYKQVMKNRKDKQDYANTKNAS